ncbi:MAG: TonB-dependent receptor [Alphaproteobacteria bacterium]|nr:TonB-dependent receptor [Alphaproteobacteria bacterium]
MRKHAALYLSAATLLSVAPLGAAQAQEIETVLVTAQKRVENVQDVPISMSVVSGKNLEDMNVRTFEDLAKYVPNLAIQPTPGANQIYIRGIGSGAQNFAFEQDVSLYIDGIYAGRNRQFMAPFFDLQRVEVLRGPQGALLGKNTAAGAISIVSAMPTDTFEAGVDVTALVTRKGVDVSGFVSGPLAEHLTGRLAAKLTAEDGYVDNVGTNRKVPGSNDKLVRGILHYEMGEHNDITGKFEYSDALTDGTPAISQFPGSDFERAIKDTSDWKGNPDKDSTKAYNTEVTANFGIGDNTLTSVTGYSTYNAIKHNGAGQINPEDWLSIQKEYFHQFSQEVRLTSPTGGMFEYIVGAYVDTSKFKSHFDTDYDLGVLVPVGGSTIRIPVAAGHSDMIFDQRTTTYSVFGQLQWNITEQFDVLGSLRYTNTSKSAVLDQILLSGVAVQPSYGITPANPHKHLSGQRAEDNVDPSITLQYKPNKLTMAYFTFAKGSKAGGFVSNSGPVTQASFGFEPETSRNLEVGVKSTLFDGLLVGSLAAFTTRFDDLQVSNYIPNVGITIGNAASATTRGFEFSADIYPLDGLSLSVAGAYLDARYDDFPGATCVVVLPCNANPALNNIGGTVIPSASMWSGTFGAQYTTPLSEGLRGTIGINGSFRSSYFTEADLNTAARSPSNTKVDARIEVADADGRWSVALVGKNLTDVHSFNFSYFWPFDGAHRMYYLEETRTIFVQTRLRF